MLGKQEMLDLLRRDVVPALGCTEPVCIALAAAKAASLVGAPVTSVAITCSPNLYKNGMAWTPPQPWARALRSPTVGFLSSRASRRSAQPRPGHWWTLAP